MIERLALTKMPPTCHGQHRLGPLKQSAKCHGQTTAMASATVHEQRLHRGGVHVVLHADVQGNTLNKARAEEDARLGQHRAAAPRQRQLQPR